MNKTHVPDLAFADDITLTTDSQTHLLDMIEAVKDFIKVNKMKINPKKCLYSSTVDSPDLTITLDGTAHIFKQHNNNEPIPFLGSPISLKPGIRTLQTQIIGETKQHTNYIMRKPLYLIHKAHLITY